MAKAVTPATGLVPCYGCCTRERRMERMGWLTGCSLCQEYGDGYGKMQREMRHKSVTVCGKRYEPPSYECIECEDSKTTRISYWRPAFGGVELVISQEFPILVVPCKMCCETDPCAIHAEMDALLAAEGVAVWTESATEAERLANLEVCDRVIANHPTIRK